MERIAREIGFAEISTSSRLSPLIKIVSRGDTTVVDGYLNPVLRAYVERLQQSLGAGQLKLMTSAGGLVDAGRFVGKDSILSGPAGGVIGFSRVAHAGRLSASRSASTWGGRAPTSRGSTARYEREFETQKGGRPHRRPDAGGRNGRRRRRKHLRLRRREARRRARPAPGPIRDRPATAAAGR